MTTVLVADGETRAALAVVRSLGRAGYRCVVVSPRRRSLAGASRWCAAQAAVPDPLEDPDGFVGGVEGVSREWSARVFLPMTEASCLATLERRDRLAHLEIPLAGLEAFRRVSDKQEVLAVAPQFGIAVPQQVVLAPGDLPAIARREPPIRYPVVLKPSRSVSVAPGSRTKVGVRHAADEAELRARLAEYPAGAFPVMIQQRILGPGVGIFLLLRAAGRQAGKTAGDEDPLAALPPGRLAVFSHRRLREKPPSGGVSVYRESIPADPDLVEKSARLLEHFGWQGVAMIEYKLDQATGTPYLMEINGRFWGSLQLAVDAGVDFPRLLVEGALGGRTAGRQDGKAAPLLVAAAPADLPPCRPADLPPYRPGIRSRWWWGDVDHLLARLRKSDEELALPPGSPGRLRALLDFLVLWRPGDRNEVFRWSDPHPFLRETLDWFRGR